MMMMALYHWAGARPEILPRLPFREVRDKGHLMMSNHSAVSEPIAINRGAVYTQPSSEPGSLYNNNKQRSALPQHWIFSLPNHERLLSFDHSPANPTDRDLPCLTTTSERVCKETSQLFKLGIPSWNAATSEQYEETHATDHHHHHHQGAHSSQPHDSATSVKFIDFLGVGVAWAWHGWMDLINLVFCLLVQDSHHQQ